MNLLCIYHKNCADGFGAALVVKNWAKSIGQTCEFVAAHYGDTPPNVVGKDVLIVDFSYSRETLLEMNQKAESLKVIDHHKTAEKNLQGLDFCIFDMEKSGAVLTWETLFQGRDIPLLLKYIQDRDLWTWHLENSRAISASLQLLKMEFHLWERYLADANIHELIEMGAPIVKYQNLQIQKILDSGDIPMARIAGHTVPCINTTHLISEIGNELCKGHPFCALYFETKDKRIYSLRSSNESGSIDVSKIAEQFGGGGHSRAAGFSVNKRYIYLTPFVHGVTK